MFQRRFRLIDRVLIRTSNPDFNTFQEMSNKMKKSVTKFAPYMVTILLHCIHYIHYYQLNIVVY